jgi:hypothetical protein
MKSIAVPLQPPGCSTLLRSVGDDVCLGVPRPTQITSAPDAVRRCTAWPCTARSSLWGGSRHRRSRRPAAQLDRFDERTYDLGRRAVWMVAMARGLPAIEGVCLEIGAVDATT